MRERLFQIIKGILIQVVIAFFLFFMALGFMASFEYPDWNWGHFVYGSLYVLLSYFFILAAKQRWHRLISIGLITLFTFLMVRHMIWILGHWG